MGNGLDKQIVFDRLGARPLYRIRKGKGAVPVTRPGGVPPGTKFISRRIPATDWRTGRVQRQAVISARTC